ncbi:MAG: glycosyltransferase family 2 protein [Kiritimatiellales bacterium]|jgi:glycosyltransferase involved in cell wall biosynthesis
MKFSIVTPSLNQLPCLRQCVFSVADQCGAEVEHIVIDGGSTDGTIAWLEKSAEQLSADRYQLSFVSEPDEGIYDALNKGFTRSSGGVFAWLNCDEQYLTGTLQKVAGFFETQPEADFVYGDVLLIDPEGKLLTCRKNPPLRRAYVLADHLYTQSAAMFFRAGIFSSGVRFDTAWKAVGDCAFVVRALEAGFHSTQIRDYLSVCTMTGQNVSRGRAGVEELKSFRRQVPMRFQLGRPVLNGLRYLEKFIRGGYRAETSLTYELYSDGFRIRKKMISEKAGCRFRWEAHD